MGSRSHVDKRRTLSYNGVYMKPYKYSLEKNQKLIQERNISFEQIEAAIENGQVLDIIDHPNPKKYGAQKMYVITANDYVYVVPFVEDKNGDIFLKTIFPSRKAKQKYLKEVPYEEETEI